MLKPVRSKQFKKDYKLTLSRGKDGSKFQEVFTMLINNEPLPAKYREHSLCGKYVGRHECHIEPDWLLIYKLSDDEIIFERTGSHSDLFK